MSQPELLSRVVRVLDACGVPYMLTGSTASSAQGEPRSSHDIDLVVDMSEANVKKVAAAFPGPEYYLSLESALEALRHDSMFNLLWINTGDKVDFWMLTKEPFDQSRFQRRMPQSFLGETYYVSTPEDTILMKLSWSQRSGGSQKQYLDALRVYEVQSGLLDESYLDRWAAELGVINLLAKLRAGID